MKIPTVIIEGEYLCPKSPRYQTGTAYISCKSIEEAQRLADDYCECRDRYKKWFNAEDVMIDNRRAEYTEPPVSFYTASPEDIFEGLF